MTHSDMPPVERPIDPRFLPPTEMIAYAKGLPHKTWQQRDEVTTFALRAADNLGAMRTAGVDLTLHERVAEVRALDLACKYTPDITFAELYAQKARGVQNELPFVAKVAYHAQMYR